MIEGQSLIKQSTQVDHARAQAEALFLSIGDGAIAMDQKGKVSRVNKIALDLLGYTREEMLGKPFMEVVHSIDKYGKPIKPIDRPITQVFVTGKSISVNTYYLRKDGTRFPASSTVSPIMLNDQPTGAIEVFRDITLEHEIDRMKSEFISIASHQLRTPLTAIKTYAHMLYKGFAGELNESQKEFISIVTSSADHMNKLIDTLLDISLIEAGKLSIQKKKVNLRSFIDDLVQEFALNAKQKDIYLEIKLGRLPSDILMDPLLVREIYANLLSNAIKYTPPKGRVIFDLRVKNNDLVAAVKDTGHGIPDKHKDRIFGKFFRAPNIMSLESNGSGLGLYMVKGIAENLGGDVWFKSKEGKGSTFYFSMPISKARLVQKSNSKIAGNDKLK